jgi:hypothetical protein
MCYTIILYFQDATVDFAFIYNKDMYHHILWDLFHFLWLRVTCYPIVCMFLYFIFYFSGPAESTHLNQSLEQRHDYGVFNISVITAASSIFNCLNTTYTAPADTTEDPAPADTTENWFELSDLFSSLLIF